MQIHAPDPQYTGSRRMRTNFRVAVAIALALVALLWLIQMFNWTLDLELQRFGVRPRNEQGLIGIFVAPLLHADFKHLLANSLPLLVLDPHAAPGLARLACRSRSMSDGIIVWLFGKGARMSERNRPWLGVTSSWRV
jgi:hypothetical protein